MATTQTESRKGPKGRQGKEGQEAALNHETVANRIEELVTLQHKAKEAADAYSDGIKATAEASGFLASEVRKFVTARAGERFHEKKRAVEQLSLLFEEVGE